jgi:rRNA maturation endonuclease Nob1
MPPKRTFCGVRMKEPIYLYTKRCQKCGKMYGTDYPKDNGICVKCRIKGIRIL